MWFMFKPTSMQSPPSKHFQQKTTSFHPLAQTLPYTRYPQYLFPRYFTYTDQKEKNFKKTIKCDGNLHVDMFHYFKTPQIICTLFAKFIYNEYIKPYFSSHVVSMIFASDLPVPLPRSNSVVMIMVIANGSGIVSSNFNLLNIIIPKFQKQHQDAIAVGSHIKEFPFSLNNQIGYPDGNNY